MRIFCVVLAALISIPPTFIKAEKVRYVPLCQCIFTTWPIYNLIYKISELWIFSLSEEEKLNFIFDFLHWARHLKKEEVEKCTFLNFGYRGSLGSLPQVPSLQCSLLSPSVVSPSIIIAVKCDEPAASTEPEAGPGRPPDPPQLHGGRGGRGGAGEAGRGQPRARRRGWGHAECGRGRVPRGGGAGGGHQPQPDLQESVLSSDGKQWT